MSSSDVKSSQGNLQRRTGYTLLELMVVVAIVGILAAIAIPAFAGYVRRSKTAEAAGNLRNLFSAAAHYYQTDRNITRGPLVPSVAACTVANAMTTNVPGNYRTQLNFQTVEPQSFRDLGFSIADPVYYQYQINDSTGVCGNQPAMALYTFAAVGDLDGDGLQSTFELAAGSDAHNELYRNAGFFVVNEVE